MDNFEHGYTFPAIRGVQAGREYYVSQFRMRLIPRLFQFDEGDLPAELRAQRAINKARLPEIADYILSNPDTYVFSALTASIDSDVRFEPVAGEGEGANIGLLRIPMSARFVINDGQHRRGAIELALEREPRLGDETIAVVFFLDRGLERSQQMFADLNRYAVRPPSSLNVLYDYRDPTSNVARGVAAESALLHDVVDKEKSSLSKRSRKLVTLSAIRTATSALLVGNDDWPLDQQVRVATEFFDGILEAFPEWRHVQEGKIVAGEVRQDFIHTHATVLHALGRAGNAVLGVDREPNWKEVGAKLGELSWLRDAGFWEGRATTAGRINTSNQHVTLTTNAIKTHLGLPLSPDEQREEDAFKRNRRKS